jgi:GNAT superfamily N-acetyltransferase
MARGSLASRIRCWAIERRLPPPADPEALDADLEIAPDVAAKLIRDNELQPLWQLLRRRFGPGAPGVRRETDFDWIIRTEHGCVAGGAIVYPNEGNGLPPSIDVAIDPRYRRRGYATKLYEAIAAAGIDVEAGSDGSMRFGTMTRMGYAFMVGRRGLTRRS